MFNYDNLYNLVFDKSVDADELIIITGYIGPAVIKDLKELPYRVNVYVGMYGNNISSILHKSLLKLNNISNVDINYTKILVHSKCYIWKKNDNIVNVLIGSANFSTSGLRTPKKEVLGKLPTEAHNEMQVYINLVKDESYSVNSYVETDKNIISFVDEITQKINDKEVIISLLAARSGGSKNIIGIETNPGDVHAAAGLNWGFSNGLPNPNDAYIKIPKIQIHENPLMFPPKNGDLNEYVDVIWDDGTEMQMLFEGTQSVDDVDYPKQISTYKSKMELGIYLRKRIGEKLGIDLVIPESLTKSQFVEKAHFYKDRFITKEMLNEYGRNSINIKLIGEKTYYFDFSAEVSK